MASYARCFVFFLLALSFSLQIHARDIKFFSKVTKTPKETHDSISLSPAMSPSLAPALSPEPEPEVVEHGYGLYGRDSYGNTPTSTVKRTENSVFEKEDKYIPAEELHSKNNENENFETGFSNGNGNEYQYSPTNENPTKSPFAGDEFSTTNENENGNENGYVSEKKGMSDTRFLENGKYYYDVKDNEKEKRNEVGNGNGYVVEKEGMSETRYKNGYGNGNGNGNGNENEKQGMSDTRFLENGKYYYDVDPESQNKDARNENRVNGYVPEYNGMSDTRFMENGKYFHDIHNQENGKNAMFNANDNENEQFQEDNHGMSDMRFMENGKYFYDVNENNNNNNNNNGNENENENRNENGNGGEYYEGNNEYVPIKKGYQYDGSTLSSNEYVTQGRNGDYGTKKFPNEYDTMEEYDREQGYLDPQDGYVP